MAHKLANPRAWPPKSIISWLLQKGIFDSCQVDLFYRLALALFHGKTWVSAYFPVSSGPCSNHIDYINYINIDI